MSKVKIKFAKVNENAKIPSREKGNVGYDIYACFNEEAICIEPHTTKMIPTGLSSIIPDGYAIILKDRGSTGSKGIPTACGVIDSNFRGEWFVALHNDTNNNIIIHKKDISKERIVELFPFVSCNPETIYYPYEKAITQAILIADIDSEIEEIDNETVENDKTNRGKGIIGSSGK